MNNSHFIDYALILNGNISPNVHSNNLGYSISIKSRDRRNFYSVNEFKIEEICPKLEGVANINLIPCSRLESTFDIQKKCHSSDGSYECLMNLVEEFPVFFYSFRSIRKHRLFQRKIRCLLDFLYIEPAFLKLPIDSIDSFII